jgi:hypothetical protein
MAMKFMPFLFLVSAGLAIEVIFAIVRGEQIT